MIEFRGGCGHTVRAKDEDAGGTVRCAYCGKSSNVPAGRDEALEALFQEVDRITDTPAPAGVRKRHWGAIFSRKRRHEGAFNPFPIILRLCYAAVLFSIVYYVTYKFLLPLWDWQRRPVPVATPLPGAAKPSRNEESAPPKLPERGLLNRSELGGLYIACTPPAATVYCLRQSDAPASGRINQISGCTAFRLDSGTAQLGDGTYVVELEMPWNHPALKPFPGYTEFRRHVERASAQQRRQLVESFFLPDEAAAVFFDETPDQKYVVRQYRNIEIRDGRSAGVRGLFLPRIAAKAGDGFSIEELVVRYVPDQVNYGFEEAHVLDELAYYGVRTEDRPWVIKGLARIGLMPYALPNGRTLVFKIGIEDGAFAARVIRESGA